MRGESRARARFSSVFLNRLAVVIDNRVDGMSRSGFSGAYLAERYAYEPVDKL